MMGVQSKVPGFTLNTIEGEAWSLSTIQGCPCLLAFFRFSNCPFSHLRLATFVKRCKSLPSNFHIIGIIDGPSNLNDWPDYSQETSNITLLIDENSHIHDEYGIGYSQRGAISSLFKRMPTLLYATYKRPSALLASYHDMQRMPADFLVDKNHNLVHAHYGRDAGDILPFKAILDFAYKATATEQPDLNSETL